MTQEQKLKKIIERGIENGYRGSGASKLKEGVGEEGLCLLADYCFRNFEICLFSKSLAKAIWGEEEYPNTEIQFKKSTTVIDKVWKMHLSLAVISDDPISYYYDNME